MISPDIGYSKAAKALKDRGYLILLWKNELQPCDEVYQSLSKVYQVHAQSLDRYEDRETQEEILRGLGEMAIDSGQLKDLVSRQVVSEINSTEG